MGTTVEQVIQRGRNLDQIIPELANLCGIYCFSDLDDIHKDRLVSLYHSERKGNVYSILDGLPVTGSTTFSELEDAQEEFSEWAHHDLDSMIEREWEDEFGLQAELDEIDLDNKFRNGDLLQSH